MASGQEMAMNAVFKWLGVNPDETKAMVAGAYGKVIGFDARLTAIELMLKEQNDLLALILKRSNGEKSNGGTEINEREYVGK